MQKTVSIDDSEFKAYTEKMRKMHKSVLPVVVRQTLNDAAFDMKTTSSPKAFEGHFTIRNKTFFSTHKKVIKCKNTFNISEMQSQFGIIKGKSTAGDRLEKQETGGTLARTNIPLDAARTGGNSSKPVAKRFYMKNIKPQKGQNMYKSQELIKAAFKAGRGGVVKFDNIIFDVRRVSKPSRDKVFMKLQPLYSSKDGRYVNIKPRPFMEQAANETMTRMPAYYEINAIKKIEKHLK